MARTCWFGMGLPGKPVGPGDLAYVQKVDGGTITNSAGDDVDLPLATVTYAGLIVDAASDVSNTPGLMALGLRLIFRLAQPLASLRLVVLLLVSFGMARLAVS